VKFNTDPVRDTPNYAAMSRHLLAIEHKVKVVRDAKRACHSQACTSIRQIPHCAVDGRAVMMERNDATSKYVSAGRLALLFGGLGHDPEPCAHKYYSALNRVFEVGVHRAVPYAASDGARLRRTPGPRQQAQ
jgi:hypothetical protein